MAEANQPDPKKPKSVSVDNQTVTQHGLRDQMDAQDRRDAKTSVKRKGLGLRRARMHPGDAV